MFLPADGMVQSHRKVVILCVTVGDVGSFFFALRFSQYVYQICWCLPVYRSALGKEALTLYTYSRYVYRGARVVCVLVV